MTEKNNSNYEKVIQELKKIQENTATTKDVWMATALAIVGVIVTFVIYTTFFL